MYFLTEEIVRREYETHKESNKATPEENRTSPKEITQIFKKLKPFNGPGRGWHPWNNSTKYSQKDDAAVLYYERMFKKENFSIAMEEFHRNPDKETQKSHNTN